MSDIDENGPVDLTNIEPDKINKLDNILWLRAEIERLQARNELLEKALDGVSMIPDKGGWELTLKAAVGIARAALKT